MNRTYWLVGASSGIGKALAEKLAYEGNCVILSARSQDPLEKIVKSLSGQGHQSIPLDVTKLESIQKAQKELSAKKIQVDSIIYLAGVYEPGPVDKLDLKQLELTIDVNVTGIFRLIKTSLDALKKAKNPELILVGSVAGYRALPNSNAYGVSKAAVNYLAELLLDELEPAGVDVKLVSPWFVESPLTDKNEFEMPGILTAKQAADYIYAGLTRRRTLHKYLGLQFRIGFPQPYHFIMSALKFVPQLVYNKIMQALRQQS